MFNDPTRLPVVMADIEALMSIFGTSLDWNRVDEYFKLFAMEATCMELKERYDAS